jgi:predicted GIY-YIG superfamily endonuclease
MGVGTSKYLQKQRDRKATLLNLPPESTTKVISSYYWVYLIKCTNPTTGRFGWYVGWTQKTPEDRLEEHLRGKGNIFLYQAVNAGCTLEVVGKERFYKNKTSSDREAQLIHQYKNRLLNIKLESKDVKQRSKNLGNTLNYKNAKTNLDWILS